MSQLTHLLRRLSSGSKRLPMLTLYTKPDCTLCEEAVDELEQFSHRFTLERVDITEPDNKHWAHKYRFHIPVFHLEGHYLMRHRVDLNKFLAALEQYEKS